MYEGAVEADDSGRLPKNPDLIEASSTIAPNSSQSWHGPLKARLSPWALKEMETI